MHAIEADWLPRMRETRVVVYRLPEASFEHGGDGFWTAGRRSNRSRSSSSATCSRDTPLWTQVAASTLEFSGIRLRNARPPAK